MFVSNVGYALIVELKRPFWVLSWDPAVVLKEESAMAPLAAEADDSDASNAAEEIKRVLNSDRLVENTVDCVNNIFDPVPLKELSDINDSEENVESCIPAGEDKYVKILDWSWPLLDETMDCVKELVVDVKEFVTAIVVEASDEIKNV